MVTAFVLITVPAKRSGGIIEKLHKYGEVCEACAVYGETDVIAKVQTSSLVELDRLVMEIIQGNEAVKTTRTYVVVENLHWER